jgi:outer membrane immunogenic protein
MSLYRTAALATLMGFIPAAGAYAADAIALPVADQAVPIYDDAGFDWNGFYAGIHGLGQISPLGGTQYGLGVQLGVNAQFDYVLLGAEVALQAVTGGNVSTAYLELLGRAGVLVTDDVALYAAAGYGIDLGAPAEEDLLVGGGVEFAVTEDVSLRAQYLHGFAVNGGNPKDQVTLGANFHF